MSTCTGDFTPLRPARTYSDESSTPGNCITPTWAVPPTWPRRHPHLSRPTPLRGPLHTQRARSYRAEELLISTQVADRHAAGQWERRPNTVCYTPDGTEQTKQTWGDPELKALHFDYIGPPAIWAWSTLIPSSRALTVLADPRLPTNVTGADGITVPIDEAARRWCSLASDAIGVRARASIMAHSLHQFADAKLTTPATRKNLRWMSVARGTAQLTMTAAMYADLSPELLLVDLDKAAMATTAALATDIGFTGTVSSHRVNQSTQRFGKFLGRRHKSEGLSRSFVQSCRDLVEVCLRIRPEAPTFGEILAQPVGVLVRASLPGTLGIAGVHLQPRVDAELCMQGHLFALVPGQRPVKLVRKHGDLRRDRPDRATSPRCLVERFRGLPGRCRNLSTWSCTVR